MSQKKIKIIGGGLAGCEAAFWLANRGVSVELYEMRPGRKTEAHKTDQLAELVCSNSFKSLRPASAPGILKNELTAMGSLVLEAARVAKIEAGEALAVDREVFSSYLTQKISSHPLIELKREEVLSLPDDPKDLCILATGPLTSSAISEQLAKIIGQSNLYFYDAISPILDASSIDRNIVFSANRYGKETRNMDHLEATPSAAEVTAEEPEGDYWNCPMSKEEYERFIDALGKGERVPSKDFEKVVHFEGCMPIEEMLDRGRDTLRFGPMKPVGLPDPRTGKNTYAVVQLRSENQSKSAFNIVGFQTKLKYGEQDKVFRLIPGLEKCEFHRFGSMHRNTFVDSPRALNLDLTLKNMRNVMITGQITGVEGYLESTTLGLLSAIFALAKLNQRAIPDPPAGTACSSLLNHLRRRDNPNFQPSSINFGLFEDSWFEEEMKELGTQFKKKIPKEAKREKIAQTAALRFVSFAERVNSQFPRIS